METQVFQREGDSLLYLKSKGQWYYYDPQSTPLGSGAMGTVYLGFSCNSSHRIAVKRIKDIYANTPTVRLRAKQEASLSFSHPNLVQMLGICECSENVGPIFVLSAYVPGVTLDFHVKEQIRNMSPNEKVQKISKEICCVLDALQYLHSRGVVHRDVKPTNIMLENGCTIKLMDLGVACLHGKNKYSSFGLIGTPQYASPEQILRDEENNEIDGRTDIYSTGITLYELLTGFNPFKSEIESDVLSKQMTKNLPYNKKIPRMLYKVIRKATEKDKEKRYKSAAEFKAALLDTIEYMDEHPFLSKFPLSLGIAILILFLIILLLLIIIMQW